MKILDHQISTQWPQIALYNYVCDIHNHALWQSNVMDAAWVGDKRHVVGAWFNEMQMVNERMVIVHKEIVANSTGKSRSISWKMALCEATLHFRFTSNQGVTILNAILEVNAEGDDDAVSALKDQFTRNLDMLKNLLDESSESHHEKVAVSIGLPVASEKNIFIK